MSETTSTEAGPKAPVEGRDERGRFRPGNLAAVSHSLRTDRLPPELEHLRDEVHEFLQAALVDEGDQADISVRRQALLTYRARVHRRIAQLDAAIELRGLFDKRGKLRAQWLQRLEGLIGLARALDAQLGLSRRPKQVRDVEGYLAQFQQRRAEP